MSVVHIPAQENTDKNGPQLHHTKQGRLNTERKPEKGVTYRPLQTVLTASITCQTGNTVLVPNSRYGDVTLFDSSAVCWEGQSFSWSKVAITAPILLEILQIIHH